MAVKIMNKLAMSIYIGCVIASFILFIGNVFVLDTHAAIAYGIIFIAFLNLYHLYKIYWE